MRKLPSGQSGVDLLAKRIGKRLSRLRNERGVSRRELATMLELPVESIEAYERGTRLPRTYTLYELANALNVGTSVLLDDEPEAQKYDAWEPRFLRIFQRLSELPDYEKGLLYNLFEPCVTGFETVVKVQAKRATSSASG